MSLVLDGTNGLSDVDGSAATPAIRGTDANTGIFFPAADTIAFAEGGAEVARIDSSGNVGIGTSSPNAYGSAYRVVQASASDSGIIQATGTTNSVTNEISTTGVIGQVGTRTNHVLAFKTNDTERARIDTSGNLLVGATAVASNERLYVNGNAGNANNLVRFTNTQTSGVIYGLYVLYSGYSPNAAGNDFVSCSDSTTSRFRAYSNGGLANYSANNVNLSDRREKTNFAPAGDYLAKICAIPVQTFNYIDQNLEEDAGLTLGVVAQDVQAVAPELVAESDWGTKDEPKMRLSIYQTDLQYALMKCIQEQQAMIEQLKADVAALKGTQP